ncbi:MAG: hypothetical protein AB8I08_19465 [Sandaracinaceae bacterium]
MRRWNLARWALGASLGVAAIGAVTLPAHADIIPPTQEEMDESRRRRALPLCPEGANASRRTNVECEPAAACSDTDACETGECARRALCLAAEQDGVRPVLGVCADGACPFGECVTERRCSGNAESIERREMAESDRLFGPLYDALEDPSREDQRMAPPPMADPDTPVPAPVAEEPPAPSRPASSGCGCRVSVSRPWLPGALLLGLVFTRSARRRRSGGSRRRTAG